MMSSPVKYRVKYLEKRNSKNEYSELRALMLEKVQSMSGHVWTDYNLHDPGVTILEQLCYALTDINYRSDYTVEDLLANDDEIDLHRHGMFAPDEALPCRPLTLVDYQKYFTDKIKEVDYVIVRPANIKHPAKYIDQVNSETDSRTGKSTHAQSLSACLFDVFIKIKEEKIYQLSGDNKDTAMNGKYIFSSDDIKRRITDEFNKIRNIGEDINEVLFIDVQTCELVADIELDDSRSAIETTCDIYYKIYKILSGSVKKHGIFYLEEKGEMLADLLSGPLTDSGYIEDTEASRMDDKIALSQVVSEVKNITGVLNVNYLAIESEDGRVYTDYLPPLSEVSYQLVIPSTMEEIRLCIKINGKPVKLNSIEFITDFEMLVHNRLHGEKSLAYRYEKRNLLHAGPEIAKYTSVQTQFPDVYGINQYGVPPGGGADRKAMAFQLKGYMMQFDHVMSDHLAMLDNIKDLFSVNLGSISSYKTQALTDDSFPDCEKLYIKYPDKEFLSKVSSYENYPERKSRIFDYLLAMNGRDKEMYGFEYKNPYFTQNELNDNILDSKCKNIRFIHKISANRASAFNYREKCWGKRNISSFEKYIANVTGVDARCRSFVYPLTSSEIKFCYHNEVNSPLFFRTKFQSVEASVETIKYFYIDVSIYKEKLSEKLAGKNKNFTLVPYIKVSDNMSSVFFESIKIRLTDNENSLSQIVLNNGVNLNNYRVGRIDKNKGFDLIFNSSTGAEKMDRWNYLASFNTLNDAFMAVNLLRHHLIHLNLIMEGLHMVEHNLLLPVASSGCKEYKEVDDDNFYVHQITVILPDWTARFSDPDFRMYTENIIRNECPAHIYVYIHWLEFQEMEKFEIIFKSWLNYKHTGNDFSKLNCLSDTLYNFLYALSHKEKIKNKDSDA